MAEARVNVDKSYGTAGELQTWLNNLGTDVNAGKVTKCLVSAEDGSKIQGYLVLSSETAVDDLTVAVEDA